MEAGDWPFGDSYSGMVMRAGGSRPTFAQMR